VWHSALRCHWKVQKLERTTITLKQNLRAAGRRIEDDALELA
jgi:hypothetical protein